MTGTELRVLRVSHGLTQRALGELLGYGARHIGRMEREAEGVSVTDRCAKLLKSLLPEKKVKKVADLH